MDTPKVSAAEKIKAASRRLRGSLVAELDNDSPQFSAESVTLLKFHGIYQQHDRDLRKAQSQKVYSCMVRVSVPGGVMRPEQYLALDAAADRVGDGTLRITSRGGMQYHYVGKRTLKGLIAAINACGLSTLAACGDVVRNVVCCAAPFDTPERRSLYQWVKLLDRALKPRTAAYAEIWLNGERAATLEAPIEEREPLYGDTYLPRKFKIGFAHEGENTTDIYSHDLGLVAHCQAGEVSSFTVLAGGGMGQTNGVKDTHPRLAHPVGEISPEDVLELAKAVVSIHRDYGNRADRRHARLKYVIEERGEAWFRQEVEARLGKTLAPPRPLVWRRHADYLGWHSQDAERRFFGLRVVSGRLAGRTRQAVAEIVRRLKPEVRLTPQQNLIFAGLPPAAEGELEAILREHEVPLPGELPPVLRHSMACPALPTCGLALTDSERVLPDVVAALQEELNALGLSSQVIHLRMTGCPNGCARPYTAEIGIVGQSPQLYSLYLGGSPLATRLATLYSHNIRLEHITATLRPLLAAYVAERLPGEAFGDFCWRAGVPALRERFLEARS